MPDVRSARTTGARRLVALASLIGMWASSLSAEVVEYELTIDTGTIDVIGEPVEALTVNGGVPGPVLEFTEGDVARIHVHNRLDVGSSVHWHGLLLPNAEDGVPNLTFPGIAPNSTFTYEFPLIQAGTYWYHSHSGLQEQRGVYGAIVIHPRGPERVPADREIVAVLSDWTNERPDRVMGLLKSGNEWYAIERNTNQSVWGALRRGRIVDFLRREWQSMPENEISDVAYDAFLINGKRDHRIPAEPGETIRLRIVNAGAASYFYVQFAGGPMTIVAADGLDVEPVSQDRFLIAIAETYDVIVTVPERGAYEFRATAQDGSGHVGLVIGEGDLTLAPEVPRPNYYINSMNSGYLRSMWRSAIDVGGDVTVTPADRSAEDDSHAGHAMHGMDQDLAAEPDPHAHHRGHASDGAATNATDDSKSMDMPMGGHGHMHMAEPQPGRPPTPYPELRSVHDTEITGARPTRTVELNLTGDMERYVWSMNGHILRPSNTIRIQRGERVRFVLSNRTMMNHPMHLHGHFFRVLNGQGERSPLKHTVDMAPMTTTVIEFDANEEKDWFFHCHVLYHMKGGMARVVHYEGTEVDAATLAVRPRLYHDPWYAFGGVAVLSQMSDGFAQVSKTRHIFGVGWEVGYDDGEYDVTGTYSYYVNRYLNLFGGVNAYDEADIGSDVRGVAGVSVLLPFQLRSNIWGATDDSFRWMIGRELQLTRRVAAFADAEYDSKTDWEWVAGGEIVVTRWLSLVGQYHSEFGAGGGVRLRAYSSGLF